MQADERRQCIKKIELSLRATEHKMQQREHAGQRAYLVPDRGSEMCRRPARNPLAWRPETDEINGAAVQ